MSADNELIKYLVDRKVDFSFNSEKKLRIDLSRIPKDRCDRIKIGIKNIYRRHKCEVKRVPDTATPKRNTNS